jgi:hypothetical protein
MKQAYNWSKLVGEPDSRFRYYIKPQRIVWFDQGDGKLENIDRLLLNDNTYCLMKSGNAKGPAFVLDFGAELNGGVCIELADCYHIETAERVRQVCFRLRFGESVSEVMGQPDNDHASHDMVLTIPFLSKQEFGLTGFRFLRIDMLEQNTCAPIRSIKAVALERPLEYKGCFESSDALLNQIWQIGARTVHLCCQDYLLDGIKRDRMEWAGDIDPQACVIANVFGDIDIVPKTLELLRNRTGHHLWMNNLCSYSLWWIITVWRWYWYTGDKHFLYRQVEYIENLIEWLPEHVDSNGREKLTGERLIDWSTVGDEPVISQGHEAMLVWAIESAKSIFDEVENPRMNDTIVKVLARLKSASIESTVNKQVNALRVLAGITSATEANMASLSLCPNEGLSPWFGFYILEARAKACDYQGCLDVILKYWGGMVKLGATTFWEHFDEAWLHNAGRIDEITPAGKHDVHAEYGYNCFKGLRHSLCHGWACGPTAWLSQNILGIQPAAPGFKKVTISPNLGNLAFAKGAVPTPFGLITVSHKRQADGKVATEYDVPKDIQVI